MVWCNILPTFTIYSKIYNPESSQILEYHKQIKRKPDFILQMKIQTSDTQKSL